MVNICYELKGKRVCQTLIRQRAKEVRKNVEEEGGTVYWFNPVG